MTFHASATTNVKAAACDCLASGALLGVTYYFGNRRAFRWGLAAGGLSIVAHIAQRAFADKGLSNEHISRARAANRYQCCWAWRVKVRGRDGKLRDLPVLKTYVLKDLLLVGCTAALLRLKRVPGLPFATPIWLGGPLALAAISRLVSSNNNKLAIEVLAMWVFGIEPIVACLGAADIYHTVVDTWAISVEEGVKA